MIDFDDIKKRYDLARMIEAETGQPVQYGKNMHCPFHADSTPSMTVYQDGHFYCHACGARGDLFDFLARLWDCDLRSVIDRLNEPGFVATIRNIPQQAKPKTTLRPTLSPGLVDIYEKRFKDRELEYWRKQAIPPSVLFALRVGWTGPHHTFPDRYAFPWFYRGILTAFKLRRDDELHPEAQPKYISETGSRFTTPYNIDAVLSGMPDTVLIVEDEKSVMAAMRYHMAAIAAPANQFKPDWISLLSEVRRIIVVADNDEAGMTSAAHIQGMLTRALVISAPAGKDLFDYHLYLHERIDDRDVEEQAMREWLGL